jgi:nitroreductase
METTALFASLQEEFAQNGSNKETLEWANDVLDEYFSVVGSNPSVDQARQTYQNSKLCLQPGTKRPYQRDLERSTGISIDQLEALAFRRRSCRWFRQEPVPRELIDRAMIVAGYAPSACNRQPYEFRFFDDPELVRKVADTPMGTVGFSHNFPCVCAIVGNMSAFPHDRDRHVPYIDASLAAMGLQFALEVQGVSSCCINWPDIKHLEHRIAKLLGLKPFERVIMMMAIGFPDSEESVPYSQKKPLAEVRSYNRTC